MNKNGSALIIVLIIMALILTISVSLAALGLNPIKFAEKNALYDQAVYAAQDFSSQYINAIKQQFIANQGQPPDPNSLGISTSLQYNTRGIGNPNIEVDLASADYVFYPDQTNWTDCHYDLSFIAKDLNSGKNILQYNVHFDINNSPPNAALLTNKDYNSGGTSGGNWWLGGFSRVVGPYYTNDSVGIAYWQNANANTNPPTAPMFDALNRFVPTAPALPDLRVGGNIIWYGTQPVSSSDWKKIAYQGNVGVQTNYPKYSFAQNVLGRGVNLLPNEAKGNSTLTGSNSSFVAFNSGFSSIVGGSYYSLYINPSAINSNYSVDQFEFSSMRMNFQVNGMSKYASIYRITLSSDSGKRYRIWLIDIPRASGSTATDSELSTKIFYVQKFNYGSGKWQYTTDPPFSSCPLTINSDKCNPYVVTDKTDFNLIYINGHVQEMQTSTLPQGDYNSSSDLYNALKLSGHGNGSNEDLADLVAGQPPAKPKDPNNPWQYYVSGRLTVAAAGDIVIGDGGTNYLNYSLTYPERLINPDGSFTSYSGTNDSRFLLGLVARNIFLNVKSNANKPPAKADYANDGVNVSDNQTYSFDGQILTFGTQTGNNDNTIKVGVFDNYHYYSNVASGDPTDTSNYPYFSVNYGNDNLLGYALTRGMLVENWHGVWGFFNGSALTNGYQDEYVYDNRLRYFVTPWFPLPKNPNMPANYSMTVEIVKL
ncbi:hypothetical protein Thena_1409 [Thermodesulfobium narugense DSM 14796]|uniref:Uncharacterized protein n=1 Tax=Thermodesulfobium narugense DSM 14796 TaxID=747365 RepID=M1E9B4_9BACT|nr:hypothetical protein [Thermodesulfobium narugense]AEE15024.1 hypothetical protein Thena_1409 [Thermodesulfobium narugense DSM 14796]